MPENQFLVFSQRRRIATLYQIWCKNNGIKDCPESMVCFLQIHGMIDTNKVLDYIESHKEVSTDV